ncbi:MAG TPA: NF038122 family metalloprotease [Pyrinomonadaceae bacterium]|nr:NF038122 family metalloprotease [Pyrinomonadaceae bacterium]
MKFRNGILACLLASLAAAAGLVPVTAGAQGGDAPAEVRKGNLATFVIYRNAAGEVACRVATAAEHRRIVDSRGGGGLRLIYRGAPRTRTPAGIVESDTVGSHGSTGDNKSSTSAATSTSTMPALLPSAGLHIFLHGTQQLEQNQAAKNAFIAAANRWESLISTPINVVIDVDFGPKFFGEAYDDTAILGQTGSRQSSTSFSNLRQRLISNSPTAAELQLYNALPASTVPVELSGGNSTLSGVALTRANARAVGLVSNIANPDAVASGGGDAGIGFNSNFNNGTGTFDFNPDDGITTGATDFDAVVTHEIGHALGFVSNSGGTAATSLSVWDVFRFRPGAANLGTLATAPRVMVKGGTQVYFNNQPSTVPATSGATELGLSTGGPNPTAPTDGDRRQSSHWKDDELATGSGPYIGIMDPTISSGARRVITDNDVKAIDSFGYAIGGSVPPPPPPPAGPDNDNFANAVTIQGASGTVNGTNLSATKEPGEPDHADTGGASVWYKWTAPATGTVTFDTVGSDYDTTLAAYTGASVNSLAKLTENDDIVLGDNVRSRISFTANAGVTYRIAVDGFDGDTGSIVLNWKGAAAPVASTIQFSSADYGVVENGVLASLTVIRTGDLTTFQTVTFITDTTGTATLGTDYNPTSLLVSFGPGETAKSLTVGIVDDAQTEPTETVALKLHNPSSGVTLGPNANATLSITDDDFAQFNNVQFASAGTTVSEDAGKFTVTVTRSGADVTHAATVFYRTVSGTASERADFTAAAGTLRFGANETSKTFDVFVTDDRFSEGAEQFNITLSDASQTTVAAPAAFAVNVTDNDSAAGASPVRWDSNFDAAFFVKQHYKDFLNREADASGLAFWTDQMTNCGTPNLEICRVNVSGSFFQAIEFQETGYLSYRAYKAAYGDAQGTYRDANGVQIPLLVPAIRLEEFLADTRRLGEGVIVGQGAWQAKLESNKVAYFEEFASRPRFVSVAPPTMTPPEFVNVLFVNAGLTPTLEQRQMVVGEFGGAQNTIDRAARGRALRRVAEDPALNQLERNRAFVTMQFFGYLRRNPNDPQDTDHTGWKFWLDKLNASNGNFVAAEMVKGFITADEYRNRFGN